MHYSKNKFYRKICFNYVQWVAMKAAFFTVGLGKILLKSHRAR